MEKMLQDVGLGIRALGLTCSVAEVAAMRRQYDHLVAAGFRHYFMFPLRYSPFK